MRRILGAFGACDLLVVAGTTLATGIVCLAAYVYGERVQQALAVAWAWVAP